jgi:hypothetical protein
MDTNRSVPDGAVVVEESLGLALAIHPRPDLKRDATRCEINEHINDFAHGVPTVFVAKSGKPLDTDAGAAHLCPKIAEHHLRNAAVVGDDRLDNLIESGLVAEPDRRQQEPVVVDLSRSGAG